MAGGLSERGKDTGIEINRMRTGNEVKGAKVSVRLDYTYVNNQSNVANLFDVHFYEYNRHIVSTQLIYDF